MIFCRFCGTANIDIAAYCKKCGKNLIHIHENSVKETAEPISKPTTTEIAYPEIPKEISSYLTKDETIEKSFQSINYNNVNVRVYATNKRIYLVSANGMGSFSVEDIGYEHISKLQFVSRIYWELLLLGLFPLLLGFTFLASGLEVANIIFSIIMFGGVAVCVYFFLNYRPHHLSIYVSGLNNPMVLTGNKTELDALFKIVREKR